ncbi:Na/Pi cotransporter family protein [Thiopseudomonas denitrificans]|uniref:Phosphate:Na+ symporter n=1 Tax=Thiopseudomonas denitrificans TaxID=1501432 RepID=A0A4R6U125_9GAMM|nr:Na/Pi cotransporter family protein [Thiopseudomonas denitrificans]TDQ39366.1 phosphate:Na+ symporter [Thiopseudomonas denitrificans]
MGIKVILNLAGGVALLLWGLHMVNTGIIRAFGARLRRFLGKVLKRRLPAFLAGMGVTAILQSSTATALMLSSFTASGLVALAPALAVMLGANVGTTLIVQVLSFDASAIAPTLLLLGFITFKRSKHTMLKDLGRVGIGLGLMLLSLEMLVSSLEPIQDAPVARELFAAITGEPVLTLLIGAVLTWAAHSSVATVLLTMSLATSGLITPLAALALVLGANLGSALNPLLEGLGSSNPAHRRMPLGNLLNRLLGCIIFVPLLPLVVEYLSLLDSQPARLSANFHMLFNLFMALVFIVPLGLVARLLERMLPEAENENDPGRPLYLDSHAMDTPSVALSSAARETMRMGDIIEKMLQDSITAIMTNDRKLVSKVSAMDDAVDRLHESIKLYVIKITRSAMDDRQSRRAMEILSLTINLEHIGDIIDKNLMELASKKIKKQLQFSGEGARELTEIHRAVQDNLRLAMSVFLSGDVASARMLLAQKNRIRDLEFRAAENHIERLKQQRVESLETSSLHLDILRDLKRIHSHVCSTAYPALEAAGELNQPGLKPPAPVTGS